MNGENSIRPGYKTTEFWVTISMQVVGLVAALGYLTPDQSSALTQAATQIGGVVSMVAIAFGYNLSRGMAKKQ
jgi:hypothetical protein